LLALVRQAPSDAMRIVIGHGRTSSETCAGSVPVDLALAGHTHGGQVVLPWLGAPITKTTPAAALRPPGSTTTRACRSTSPRGSGWSAARRRSCASCARGDLAARGDLLSRRRHNRR
jgi:hypothetical protein